MADWHRVRDTSEEPLSGQAALRFMPVSGDESEQTATVDIGGEEPLPPGASRVYDAGPFKAVTAGEWVFEAGEEITRHPL